MALTQQEKRKIKQTITDALKKKFSEYVHDGTKMPFHTRLLGEDRMALFSFIQSLNTTFGTAVYEPVAEALAEPNFSEVRRGHSLKGVISQKASNVITEIVNEVKLQRAPSNQKLEQEKIRKVCQEGNDVEIKLRKVDIYLFEKENNLHHLIDIKTAKANKDGFEKYKQNILEWTAALLHEDKDAEVKTMIAIPYNPSDPKPYSHWPVGGVLEEGTQIKVADQFWDFLAGKPVFDDILTCFQEVGAEMRDEINKYFARFESAGGSPA